MTGGGMRRALREKDFRRLVVAMGASAAGDWIYGTALVVYVYEATRSPAWVAAAGAFRLVPYIFLSPIAGAIADRFDRKKVMVISDLARAALMFALAASAAAGAPIVLAIAIAFLSTVAATAFTPALSGFIPKLVEERDLAAANAGISTIEHTALVVGPVFGAVLLLLGSPAAAFALNGVTFLVSAALVIGIKADGHAGDREEEGAGLRKQVAEGLRAVTASGSVGIPIFIYALASLAYGFEIVALVVVAERLIGIGAEGVGFLNAGIGLGGVAAAGISSRLAEDPRSGRTLALSIVCCGLPLAALAFGSNVVIACLLAALIGAGNIILEVMTVTVLQRLVDERAMARVFGILDSIGVMGIVVGSAVAAPLITGAGIRTALVVIGIGVPTIAATLTPKIRQLDAIAAQRAEALAPLVEQIESSGVFEGASRQTLERLAGDADVVPVSNGSVIVREGDPADDFFIVMDGAFVVTTTDGGTSVINRMGRGDYFGEIGLLERMPRTANVRAAEDGTVLRISGDAFLEAVTRPRGYSTTLVHGVVTRLERTHPARQAAIARPERS